MRFLRAAPDRRAAHAIRQRLPVATLFVIISANGPAAFDLTGWPPGSSAVSAFDGKPQTLPPQGALRIDLPPYGVAGLRFEADS